MSTIRAFKAIRPIKELADKVAALPYDVMNSNEAREMVKGNPYSFLHIDKAEIDLDENIDLYDKRVYEKARDNLEAMIAKKVMIQDETPCMYIYRLTMNGRSQTGLVACASIDEYINGTIKKHELTREDKEQDRINHVDYCNANTGPIFLAYRNNEKVNEIIETWINSHKSEYCFETEDKITHEVWVIDDNDIIKNLEKTFVEIPNLYIADGHHRNASAVKVGLKRRTEKGKFTGNEEFNYYLSVIFPDNQLKIMDYNRVVKDLNGLSVEQFIEKIREKAKVKEMSDEYRPEKIHTVGMYLDGKWYSLEFKEELTNTDDPVAALDVSIMQNEILNPILGIGDPRTDKRIDFIGGIRGLSELVKRVDSGEMKVAFAMYPTSIDELMAIADAGKVMPPKSTWFEPKLRSGIFIHSLD